MNRWAFRSYIEGGVDQIRLWYGQQPLDVQAELLNIIMYLRDTPADDWVRPDYDQLKGSLADLGELRVINVEASLRVHYRVLGFMDQRALEFTMLAADRKTRRFSYREIGALALRRKALIHSSRPTYSGPADWIFT